MDIGAILLYGAFVIGVCLLLVWLGLHILVAYQERQVAIAERAHKSTQILQPAKGYIVVIKATPQGTSVQEIDVRENIKALPQRYYVPTELDDDTYNFALSILFESKKRFGNASQEILQMREFKNDESKWRRATDWLAANYRINKTPLHTTTTGPYYTSVAELYVDVASKRVPIALGNSPIAAPWATAMPAA